MAYGRDGGGAGPFSTVLASVFIAAGIAMAGSFIATSMVQAPTANRTISVVGVAERDVIADVAIWPLTLSSWGNDLTIVQENLDADINLTRAFLIAQGFDTAEISPGQLTLQDGLMLGNDAPSVELGRYRLSQTLTLRTTDVDQVAAVSQSMGDLLRQGVIITDLEAPSYVYTQLDELREAVQEDAVQAARSSAQAFADQSGADLGPLLEASQTDVTEMGRSADGGGDEQYQIFKRVRAVTPATFLIIGE